MGKENVWLQSQTRIKKCDWGKEEIMPYKDKDRKTWIAQWFEEDIMGEKVRK